MTYREEYHYDSVINSRILPENLNFTELTIYNNLSAILGAWAGNHLTEIKLSGSRAKGTATDLTSDMDIFVSLSSTCPHSLKDIYNSCYDYLRSRINHVRKQNVSIGVTMSFIGATYTVDIVPARRQSQWGGDHSLYKNKSDTWIKTNVDTHIRQIQDSGRQFDIVALKIWRDLNNIKFPSIYLECFALEYLKYRPLHHCTSNFYHLLNSIASNIEQTIIYDPANSNNILSDELTLEEKANLALCAKKAASKSIYDLLK